MEDETEFSPIAPLAALAPTAEAAPAPSAPKRKRKKAAPRAKKPDPIVQAASRASTSPSEDPVSPGAPPAQAAADVLELSSTSALPPVEPDTRFIGASFAADPFAQRSFEQPTTMDWVKLAIAETIAPLRRFVGTRWFFWLVVAPVSMTALAAYLAVYGA